ncbi:phage regulatory CII family protein [Vibrio algicola]|uniref:Transcriptional regulator n=1 Tax=Vibrio algicola TaxID=2662262 RepID=A0A5Q0THE7_9VIBR|nr:phage regulatory CII family protein [Vibrio algicola]
MNANENMCEFRDETQSAFDDACCAFASTENMTQIARALGMSAKILHNKLNPEQPHKLNPIELIAITKVSGNFTLLNCLLNGVDVVTAQIPKSNNQADLITRALEAGMHSGDLQRMAASAINKINMSRTERHNLIQKCQLGIGNLVMLVSDLENRSGSFTTLVSMSSDMALNGFMPGLS